MKRPTITLAIVALLFATTTASELHAASFGVDTIEVGQEFGLAVRSDPSLSVSTADDQASELDLPPYHEGTLNGFRIPKFFTKDGDFVFTASEETAAVQHSQPRER